MAIPDNSLVRIDGAPELGKQKLKQYWDRHHV